MKFGILILSIALMASSLASHAQSPLNLKGEEASSIGIYIKDIETDKVLVDYNSKLALTPASVMKAVTTASALWLCGPDTCFTTTVGLSGQKEGSTWHGNLIIKATADPTIDSEFFKERRGFCDSIAAALKRRGIRKIEGTVVVEERLSQPGPNWQWEVEDIAWPYGAGLFGFNYRDNTSTLAPATGVLTPEVPGMEVCVERAKTNDIVRGIGSNRLTVYTKDPNDRNWRLNVTVPDPAAMFIAEMKRILASEGISVGDKALKASEFTEIYLHRSPRFGEIMKSLMVRSDNLFAEGILRSMAPDSSRKAAIDREKALWTNRGISAEYTTINDASGLARSNRLSPLFLGSVLEWMAKSNMAKRYTSFFPRAGKDGTMRGFLAKSPLKGRIALKTGSIGGVQCYAGYKLDSNNEPTHVIVIMVNGFYCPRKEVRIASEDLLTELFIKK